MTTPYHRECLRRELAQRLSQNPRYSLRAFSRSLQVPPSSLSRALSGKRSISLTAAKRIVDKLALSPRERSLFFDSLGGGAKSKRDVLQTVDGRDGATSEVHALAEETFRAIADWYHYAILEMTYLKGFREDPGWIASRLGISPVEARLAVERLLRLGLLKREGKRLVKSQRTVWAQGQDGQSSAALRAHQKQSLARASAAIDTIPFDRRTSSVMTMPIDPGKLALARRLIEDFAVDLCRTLSSKARTDVYQLTISFHSLLQGETT